MALRALRLPASAHLHLHTGASVHSAAPLSANI